MKVTGFTFIRNAVSNDYPIKEAILSVLPLCDEFIVALGNSTDETSALVKSIDPKKIRTIDTIWDENLREGGRVFAAETNKALAEVSKDTDWLVYIQGDEAIHEDYLPLIRQEMEKELHNDKIEALLLKYKHFYGSYDYVAESRSWYRREIRVIKNLPGVKSYKDAQGFRIFDRKLNVKLIDAYVFHYGWVKPPAGLVRKGINFNLYYDKNAVQVDVPSNAEFDYGNADNLKLFKGTHPKVMLERVNALNWKFSYDPSKIKSTHSLRVRILNKIQKYTNIRIGEYKNYKIVAK
ncbi:glycosyltransferase family protein [Pedobacter jejuensis]|uniref:Glycosyltransferase family 2 protein n=1 Tax=Pedobacter jejuensis TaxID=1268550 RepID=A0A3N0BMT5_9SPHI|nr:glycosyltransferase family 2 protein [Pedobacter jejuensis]RNL49613.1 glycosyltransferase family 2 protein [Pedobacter jejuensis]